MEQRGARFEGDPTVVGVVLAAGRGARLGGPKALLAVSSPSGDVPLALAHARAWSSLARVLIVTRADIARSLVAAAPELAAALVVSVAPDEEGPAGSLARAVMELEGDELLLVTPVDCPPVAPEIPRALVAALVRDPHAWAAKPRFRGRGGHPVALRPELWRRYRSDRQPLRERLRAHPERVLAVVVDDPAVCADIDTAAALGGTPRFFGGERPGER